MSLGDHNTARMLYKHYDGDMDNHIRAPKGFNRIGSGCSRTAILDKATSIVYKIGDYDSNISEAYNSRRLKGKPFESLGHEVVIPRTRTYRMPNKSYDYWGGQQILRQCVIAQEWAGKSIQTFCPAQNDWMDEVPPCNCKSRYNVSICFADLHDRLRDMTGIEDIHSGNVLMDSIGKFWIVDMAS